MDCKWVFRVNFYDGSEFKIVRRKITQRFKSVFKIHITKV